MVDPDSPHVMERMAMAVAAAMAAERRKAAGGFLEALPFKVKESIVLEKFDHTPQPGEVLAPFEVVEVHDGAYTLTVPPSEESQS